MYLRFNCLDGNMLIILFSNVAFSMAQLQQCCLFHDLLLPLLCNQAVAFETSRKASNSCVSEKHRAVTILFNMDVHYVNDSLPQIARTANFSVSPERGKAVMQQWDGN